MDTAEIALPPKSHSRIMELDGIRAFAALGVMFFHMYIYVESVPKGPQIITDIMEWMGPKCVDLFFLISGYVITNLLIKEKMQGAVSIKGFYIRRFFRIVPALYVYLVAVLLLRELGLIEVEGVWISAVFLTNISGLFEQDLTFAVGHTWSLSVEEQFYLLMPVILLILGFRKSKTKILVISGFYFTTIFSLALASRASSLLGESWIHLAALFKFRYIVIGVAIALFKIRGNIFSGTSSTIPILALLVAYGLTHLALPSPYSLLTSIFEPFALAIFLFWFPNNPEKCGLLRLPTIQWRGRISYSIYLWQQLLTMPAHYYLRWNFSDPPWLAFFIILALAAASYQFVEKPCIQIGRKWSSRLSKPRTPSKRLR